MKGKTPKYKRQTQCEPKVRATDLQGAEIREQAGGRGERDECGRRHHASGRVVPADERLEAEEARVGGADQRLVEQPQLPGADRVGEVLLDLQLVLGDALHLSVEIAAGAAALVLRLEIGRASCRERVCQYV